MPGVTFFCVFVRPETNRQGVLTTPLGRMRVKAGNTASLNKHYRIAYKRAIGRSCLNPFLSAHIPCVQSDGILPQNGIPE